VLPLARWYRTAFIKSVYEAIELLIESGRYGEAEELCTRAMRTDPFDEEILEYHLRSLLAQGKTTEALDEYKKMEAMYYDMLGVSFSDNLRMLHERIQASEIREDMSLESILEDWLHGADYPGAYYCDLSVFKSVCQIEARSASRSGRTAYIVRFEALHQVGEVDGIMKQLSHAIPRSLRKGDIFTRSAPGQYMIMLNSLTYEDCKMLVKRITDSVGENFASKITGTSIKPIKPIG